MNGIARPVAWGRALLAATAAMGVIAGAAGCDPARDRAHGGPGGSPSPSGPAGPPGPAPTVLPPPPAPPGPPDVRPFAGVPLTVPAWGPGANAGSCPVGSITFGPQGQYVGARRVVNLMSFVVSDVDADHADDYVAFLMCGEGPESPGWQVVAFRRSGGQLLPIGRVIGSQDGLGMMSGLQTRPGGRIAVNVAAQYSDSGEQSVPHQWRTYGWQGGRFRQVDGPTSFPPHPPAANLAIDPVELILGKVSGGLAGELAVTVHNYGTAGVAQATLMVILPDGTRPAGNAWTGCTMTPTAVTAGDPVRIDCALGPLAAHAERTLTLAVVARTPPRTTGSDVPGQFEPSNHYLSIGQLPPYTFAESPRPETQIQIIIRLP